MKTDTVFELRLTDTESTNFLSKLSQLGPYWENHNEFQSTAVQALRSGISGADSQKIRNFFRGSSPCLLFKNLPKDSRLPPTPKLGSRISKQSYVSEGVLMAIGQTAGMIFGREDEFNGELVHNVTADRDLAMQPSSGSYAVPFAFHTERAALESPPDALALYCLRGAADATTYVAGYSSAVRLLSSSEIELLSKPLYRFLPGKTSSVGGPQLSSLKPMLRMNGRRISGTVDFSFGGNLSGNTKDPRWRAISAPANQAAKALENALEQVKVGVRLEPGWCLLLNNHRVAHSRSVYDPDTSSGLNRWLQRVYIRESTCRRSCESCKVECVRSLG